MTDDLVRFSRGAQRSTGVAGLLREGVSPGWVDPVTAASSLGVELGLGDVHEDELYAALDWLLERQRAIETTIAKRHLKSGTLVLYDVSSSYVEGRCCPLAKRGYNRDGKKGKLQIVYGLLCAPDGCPVAIEVFEGNTGDPATLADQVANPRIKVRGAASPSTTSFSSAIAA